MLIESACRAAVIFVDFDCLSRLLTLSKSDKVSNSSGPCLGTLSQSSEQKLGNSRSEPSIIYTAFKISVISASWADLVLVDRQPSKVGILSE